MREAPDHSWIEMETIRDPGNLWLAPLVALMVTLLAVAVVALLA